SWKSLSSSSLVRNGYRLISAKYCWSAVTGTTAVEASALLRLCRSAAALNTSASCGSGSRSWPSPSAASRTESGLVSLIDGTHCVVHDCGCDLIINRSWRLHTTWTLTDPCAVG